jgi:glycyl-tRNA synthetase
VTYDEKKIQWVVVIDDRCIRNPVCITVDHQTIEDQTVTIRHRDTMKQDRVMKITDLNAIIENEVSMKKLMKNVITSAM